MRMHDWLYLSDAQGVHATRSLTARYGSGEDSGRGGKMPINSITMKQSSQGWEFWCSDEKGPLYRVCLLPIKAESLCPAFFELLVAAWVKGVSASDDPR